jgi:hypothetical protein
VQLGVHPPDGILELSDPIASGLLLVFGLLLLTLELDTIKLHVLQKWEEGQYVRQVQPMLA